MKVLVVRFSSIGDIVLTTPVVRALKQQKKGISIHYLTKVSFQSLLQHNPNIDKLITIQKSINEVIEALRSENYDLIIDLHHNLRTLGLRLKLGKKAYAFPKLQLKKWILVNFKKDLLPEVHIVDRYFETVRPLGVVNDKQSCELFLSEEDKINVNDTFGLASKKYLAVAIGAQYKTKQVPIVKLVEILSQITMPIVLLGGETDRETGERLKGILPEKNIINTCGDFTLLQSASIVEQADVILTNDTGLMHIASCFQIPTVSVWGNTVPSFGMYPYFPNNPEKFTLHEVKDLSCRPCSKIGFQSCPKKHFKCMLDQDANKIVGSIEGLKS